MELVFDCLDVAPDKYGASPTLIARLKISETTGEQIHSIGLRIQVRIEPQRRNYSDEQKEGLYDVFGEPKQWGETLRPMQFANISHSVQGFTGSTEVEVSIPVSYDLEVATGQLFDVIDDGEIPMLFLFSGTVFARGASGFEIFQVPWDKETAFRFPAGRWRELMDIYFPGQGWLRLDRDTINEIRKFKRTIAVPTWENAVQELLRKAKE